MSRHDQLSIGPAVPAAVLRALAPAVAAASGAVIGLPLGWMLAITAAALAGALLPHLGGVWMAAGALALALLFRDADPLGTAVVVAAVPLLHVLSSLSLVVPLSARIALRALAPSGIRYVVIQAISQPVALAVTILPARAEMPLATLAAAAAVLALAVFAMRMLRGGRQRAFVVPTPGLSAPDGPHRASVGGRS